MTEPSEACLDHTTLRHDEAGKDGSAEMPPANKSSTKPAGSIAAPGAAVAGMRDQIETWVNEGGAGDDVDR